MPSFYVHGYQAEIEEEERCARCDRNLKGRSAYDVSYDGVVAKYRVCVGCQAFLRASFGVKEAEGGPGRGV